MREANHLVVVLFCSLLASACVHRIGEFDPLSSPSNNNGVVERGWARLVVSGDWKNALKDFQHVATDMEEKDPRTRCLSRLGAGFVHLVQMDLAQAEESFLSTIEAQPSAPESLVAAAQLRTCASQVPGAYGSITSRLRILLESTSDLSLETARMIRMILRDGAQQVGDQKQITQIDHDLGVVPFWQTAFPFGRHSLVDFDTPFSPERDGIRPTPGIEVFPLWPEELNISPDKDSRDGILYTESFFYLEKQTRLVFRVAGNKPWSLFLDNSAFYLHDSHKKRLPPVVYLPALLNPGWHRLLLKIPRIRDKVEIEVEAIAIGQGAAPIRWRLPDDPPVLSWSTAAISKAVPLPTTAMRIASKAENSEQDILSRLLAGILFLDDEDTDSAGRWMAEIATRLPNSSFVAYLQHVLAVMDSNLSPEIEAAQSLEKLQHAIEQNPDFLLARFASALLDFKEGREEQALRTLQDLEAVRPNNPLWPKLEAQVYGKLGWEHEADAAYQLAMNRFPEDPDLMHKAFGRAVGSHSFAEADRLAEKLSALGLFDEEVALFLNERGKTDHAVTLLRKHLERCPAGRSVVLALFDLFYAKNDFDAAHAVLNEAERKFGPWLDLLQRRSNLQDALGKHEEANKTREKIFTLAPWNLNARQAIAAAKGSAEIHLAGDRRFDALEAIAEYRQSDFKPSGNAVLVLDQATVELAETGGGAQRIRMIVHVLTSEGVEQWGEIEQVPSGAVVEQLRTIGSNLQLHDAEIIPEKESFSLPALQPGDFIELTYVQEIQNHGPFQKAYSGDRFFFQTPDLPIFRSVYSVAIPNRLTPVIDIHGTLPPFQESQEGSFDVFTWETRQMPAVPTEPYAPPRDETIPFVQIGFGVDWPDYRDGLRTLLDETTLPSISVTQYYAAKTASAKTEEEKLSALFHAVTTEILQTNPTYDFQTPAPYVLAQRAGNRLVLLTALLRTAGYQPQVLLVRPVEHAQIEYRTPNNAVFSYGLLSLTIKGTSKTIWLDPTSSTNPFGELFPFLFEQLALDVTSQKGTDPFVRLPTHKVTTPLTQHALVLQLSTDGTLSGSGEETITSSTAAKDRYLLGSMSGIQRQQVLEAGLNAYFPGAIPKKIELLELEHPASPLVVRYEFLVPNFAHCQDTTLIIRGGFYPYQLGQNVISKSERTLPLVFGDITSDRTHVEIVLPEGSTVTLLPEDDFSSPHGDFKLRSVQKGNRLVLEKTLLVKAGRIAPKDYPAFVDFCHRVDQKDTQEITIQLKPR
jgi:cellulose synthase operon protein C